MTFFLRIWKRVPVLAARAIRRCSSPRGVIVANLPFRTMVTTAAGTKVWRLLRGQPALVDPDTAFAVRVGAVDRDRH